jgi:uncharacterized membrane protein YphA (DoxX/SURF4 family)
MPPLTRFVFFNARLDALDARVTLWMARHGLTLLRWSVGAVFLWFGFLKFFPGLSPADELAGRTISRLTGGLVDPAVSLPALAAWECLIGIGLLSGKFMRATLLLLAAQMAGTLLPLVLFPEETFTQWPYAPTLEGQYILKNAVIISAAIVLGATVRGGGIVPEPSPDLPPPAGDPPAQPALPTRSL